MFGTRYNVVCPKCRTTYEADHGMTNFYKIASRGNNQDYCKEICPKCGLVFFHLGGDRGNEQVYSARYRGLTAAECTAEKLDMIHYYRRTSVEEEADIRRYIDELYSIPFEDISIPVSDVKNKDLTWSNTVFF